jgi:hypothetical protein
MDEVTKISDSSCSLRPPLVAYSRTIPGIARRDGLECADPRTRLTINDERSHDAHEADHEPYEASPTQRRRQRGASRSVLVSKGNSGGDWYFSFSSSDKESWALPDSTSRGAAKGSQNNNNKKERGTGESESDAAAGVVAVLGNTRTGFRDCDFRHPLLESASRRAEAKHSVRTLLFNVRVPRQPTLPKFTQDPTSFVGEQPVEQQRHPLLFRVTRRAANKQKA